MYMSIYELYTYVCGMGATVGGKLCLLANCFKTRAATLLADDFLVDVCAFD